MVQRIRTSPALRRLTADQAGRSCWSSQADSAGSIPVTRSKLTAQVTSLTPRLRPPDVAAFFDLACH